MKECNLVRGSDKGRWCASFRDTNPKGGEFTVKTACAHIIVLPHEFKRGVPTCPECLKNVMRRRCNQ